MNLRLAGYTSGTGRGANPRYACWMRHWLALPRHLQQGNESESVAGQSSPSVSASRVRGCATGSRDARSPTEPYALISSSSIAAVSAHWSPLLVANDLPRWSAYQTIGGRRVTAGPPVVAGPVPIGAKIRFAPCPPHKPPQEGGNPVRQRWTLVLAL